jgi:hypothetical protein
MAFHPGDRVELVATYDPSTRLQTGDCIHSSPKTPSAATPIQHPDRQPQQPIRLAGRRPPADPTGRRLSC